MILQLRRRLPSFIHLFSQKFKYRLIIFRDVRETAAGTILKSPSLLILPEDRIPRAVRIRIHRTVTKQAVKISPLHTCMAGEIWTPAVFKKALAVFWLHTRFPPLIIFSYHNTTQIVFSLFFV